MHQVVIISLLILPSIPSTGKRDPSSRGDALRDGLTEQSLEDQSVVQ